MQYLSLLLYGRLVPHVIHHIPDVPRRQAERTIQDTQNVTRDAYSLVRATLELLVDHFAQCVELLEVNALMDLVLTTPSDGKVVQAKSTIDEKERVLFLITIDVVIVLVSVLINRALGVHFEGQYLP